jgi:hypothetical protein
MIMKLIGVMSALLIFNHIDIKISYLSILSWGMSQKSHKRALILYYMYVRYYVREDVYSVFCVRGARLQFVFTMFILIKNTVST